MSCLAVWDLFNAGPVHIQNVVGALVVIGILPAGLLVIPLYVGISFMTGNVFLLGDSNPFLTEFMLALAVFLNSLAHRRRGPRQTASP